MKQMSETRPEWLAEIDGAEALFNWFGYWPSFHDATIISVHLDGHGTSSVRIQTCEVTSELDSKGYYIARKYVTVSFLLDGISDLELTGPPGSVIFGAEISRTKQGFRLDLDPSYGLAGSLTAAKMRIEIEPAPLKESGA